MPSPRRLSQEFKCRINPGTRNHQGRKDILREKVWYFFYLMMKLVTSSNCSISLVCAPTHHAETLAENRHLSIQRCMVGIVLIAIDSHECPAKWPSPCKMLVNASIQGPLSFDNNHYKVCTVWHWVLNKRETLPKPKS